jgi:hypothetical protein
MFTAEVIRTASAVAEKHRVEPAALLAVIEVECNGRPTEIDGRTPTLLFERHVFYRELKKQAAKLALAVSMGLALPKWSPKSQYKDQGKSAARLALIAKARGVAEDPANRSASWGVGQTMGFHATEIGFRSATQMVAFMTQGGLPAQIEVMCRNITQMKLWDELERHDWAGFAFRYNGSGYRQNSYDTKMAGAYTRWTRKLANGVTVSPAEGIPEYEIRALQQKLKDLGYAEIGVPDGKWGTRTTAALVAFQSHEGLPTTGKLDDATKQAIAVAIPREVSAERRETTPNDLRQAGSETIKAADRGSVWAKILLWLGIGGGAEQAGGLDAAQEVIGKVSTLGSIINGAREGIAALAPYWWIGAVALGAYFLWTYRDVIRRRVADHISGLHAGR